MALDEHDVFISYSRADGEFVRLLQDGLTIRDRHVWVDWQDIPPTAEWMDEIRRAVDASDAVVFVLSPDSVGSPVCRKELEHAMSANKRIIPIVARAVEPATTPEALARLNWILADGDGFDRAVDRVVEALDTDLERVRAHSRLLVRAREWASKGENRALLLRGSELTEAEVLIGIDSEPRPTPEQTRFVLASRRAAATRQRAAISIVTMGFVLAAGLGVFAWAQRGTAIEQRRQAEHQAAIANSGALATKAMSKLDEQPDLAALLSLEAQRVASTSASRQAVHVVAQRTVWVERVMRGHSTPIFRVAFSPDGSELASGSLDGTVGLWDPGTGESLGQPLEANKQVQDLAFSPDGSLLATGGDRNVILWDTATWGESGRPLRHAGQTYGLAFSPSGKVLAVGQGTSIRLWKVGSRRVIGEPLVGHHGLIWDTAFSPDGSTLASAGGDGTVQLWNVASGQPLGKPLKGGGHVVTQVVFSPDGGTLASGDAAGRVRFWDPDTGELIGQPLVVHGQVTSVVYSPDGTMVATGSETGGVRYWDAQTHRPIGGRFEGQAGNTRSLALSPDGTMLVSGSDTGNLVVWGPIGMHVSTSKADVFDTEYSPDGRILATGDAFGDVRIWDPATGRTVGSPFGHPAAYVNDLAFGADHRTLAAGYGDGTAALWNTRTATRIGTLLRVDPRGEVPVAFSPDGRVVATGSHSHTVTLWDVRTGEQLGAPLEGHTGQLHRVAFTADGSMLASSSIDGSVILWDPETGMKLGSPLPGPIPAGADVYGLAFSPDGSRLASGYVDGSVRLWDPGTGRQVLAPIQAHSAKVTSLAFSPDNHVLASGSIDGEIALWDVRTGAQIGEAMPGYGAVWGLAFSPDGRSLASGGSSGSTYVRGSSAWSSDMALLRERLCASAGRNLTRDEWDEFLSFEPYRETCPGELLLSHP